jgi:hypothetical protein
MSSSATVVATVIATETRAFFQGILGSFFWIVINIIDWIEYHQVMIKMKGV